MPQIGSLPPIYERPSRILIVDENGERRSALASLMRGEGYDIKEISSLDKLLETVTSLSLESRCIASSCCRRCAHLRWRS